MLTPLRVAFVQVRIQLQSLPSMKEWPQGPQVAAAPSVQLPSFHSYPLPYVTAIGEYLMTMPQQVGGGRWAVGN